MLNCKRGNLFVLSGPSGCGKDTVLNAYLNRYHNAFLSVSVTTRAPRTGEVDGKDYYFITKKEMDRLIAEDGVLEYAEYCGNYYGTPKKKVETRLNNGENVILEIETVGAMNIKKIMPEAILLFIAPPSIEELRRRLSGRGTDAPDVIEKRLARAQEEMKLVPNYNYCIINDAVEDAAEKMHHIIEAESCRVR